MDAAVLAGSLAACAVMIGAAALTGWGLDAVSRRHGGIDDYFWTAFGGLVVLVGAGVAAGTLSGAGSVMAMVVGVGSPAATAAWVWWRHGRRRRAAGESVRAAAWEDLRRRHDAVIRRWADYDVDPAKAIDHPGMHDPGNPAARPVIRALRSADVERSTGARAPGGGLHGTGSYADAVARLEHAFDVAEQEIGASAVRRVARHRAAPGPR